METINVCVIIGFVLGVYMFVRKLNEIWYLVKLGRKAYKSLPPGDMGWPLLGSSFSFYKAFTVGGDPDSFINHLLSKYVSSSLFIRSCVLLLCAYHERLLKINLNRFLKKQAP